MKQKSTNPLPVSSRNVLQSFEKQWKTDSSSSCELIAIVTWRYSIAHRGTEAAGMQGIHETAQKVEQNDNSAVKFCDPHQVPQQPFVPVTARELHVLTLRGAMPGRELGGTKYWKAAYFLPWANSPSFFDKIPSLWRTLLSITSF